MWKRCKDESVGVGLQDVRKEQEKNIHWHHCSLCIDASWDRPTRKSDEYRRLSVLLTYKIYRCTVKVYKSKYFKSYENWRFSTLDTIFFVLFLFLMCAFIWLTLQNICVCLLKLLFEMWISPQWMKKITFILKKLSELLTLIWLLCY